MKNHFFLLLLLCNAVVAQNAPALQIRKSVSIDSLGACQGISFQQGRLFLYGDREVGMIREYKQIGDSLQLIGKDIRLSIDGKDVINHPTGIAWHGDDNPVFIGNSIRMNPEGTLWKAVIYLVNWKGLLQTGSLDGNLLNTIEDDACIQGTRPEYVEYKGKWYVATADYGNKGNEVRLYDPEKLAKASKTSEPGVVVAKFSCTAWVQNLLWIPELRQLVLIQNQIEGRRWRFTFLDFDKSVASGKESVIRVVDLDPADELEGFTLAGRLTEGIAVSSSRRNNISFMQLRW
jgi:hypothetical protein